MSPNGVGALERGYRRTPQRETLELLITALELGDEDRRKFEVAAGRQRSRLASSTPQTAAELPSEIASESPPRTAESDEPHALGESALRRFAEKARPVIVIVLAVVALGWIAKSAWPSAANTPIQPSPSEVNDLEKSETGFWPAIYDTPQPQGSYAPFLPAKVGTHNGQIANINAATWTTYFHGAADVSIVMQLNSQAQKQPRPVYVSIPTDGQTVIDPMRSYSVSAAIWFVGQDTIPRLGGYTIVSEGYPSPFVLRLNRNRVAEFIVQSRAKQLQSPAPWTTVSQPVNSVPMQRTSLPPAASDRVRLDGPLWYVILGVYDSSRHVAKLYVNGACKDAQHVNSTLGASSPLIVGGREGRDADGRRYVGDPFEGRIAQILTFDHALSQPEAHALYWIVRQNLYLPSAQIDPTPTPGPSASPGLCDS